MMNTLTLSFQQNLTRYFPGETLRGTVTWQLEKEEKRLILQVLWRTDGESVSNRSVVDRLVWDLPGHVGEKEFAFTLPAAPHSFQGQLIRLQWLAEVVAAKNHAVAQAEFTLSPTGEPLKIPEIGSESPKG